jgi:TPR repeat protein
MAIDEGSVVAHNALELFCYSKVPTGPGEDVSKHFSKKRLCSRLRADALKMVRLDNWSTLEKLITKALRKDPGSMLEIGQKYYTGKDFDQDKDIGFRWMLKGAQGGSIEAQHIVASMYKDGDFVGQNYHSAGIWSRRAAKKGDAVSQYQLGRIYYQGLGVREDPLEAS